MGAASWSAEQLLPGLLTPDLPGIGGRIRQRPEDFYVEEIPLYGPSGEGAHTLFEIEKRGIDTARAIRALAQCLRIPPTAISSAGLKDAQAVARQHLSVEGVPPERVLRAHAPSVRVLWAERHSNRLKIGHLLGNRFALRIRDVEPDALPRARAILQVLERRGLPNGFGPQRFGLRQVNHRLGRAMLVHDARSFCDLLLGEPDSVPSEDPSRAARERFAEGDLGAALRAWPAALREERDVLQALSSGASPEQAALGLARNVRRLISAAYQSYLFNRLLDARLPDIDRLERGDLALLHANDAFFLVEDPAAEQERADHLEISPSGPVYGFKVRLAREGVGDREHGLLREEGIALNDFRGVPGGHLVGERRAFRAPIGEVAVQREGADLLLRFTLPKGAYATNLLREVTKRDVA